MFTIIFSNQIAFAETDTDSTEETVILSSKDDPYYALAEEISVAEGLPIFHTFEEAAETKPQFLLWVIASSNLIEENLIDFSIKLRNLPGSISVGIFSGQSMVDARSLWIRGGHRVIDGNDYAIINGNGASQRINPEITTSDGSNMNTATLTKENILDVLANTSNFQISLEGAAGLWFDQHAHIDIRSEDIPQLEDTIIMHYGCSTFRPWEDESIAISCVHQGALAYLGFIYPSIVGKRFGDYSENALIYTWEKFPVGHLVQLQSQAAMQSYMDGAHFYMLGDPRIYRQTDMPYTLVSDETNAETRKLVLADLPNGIIPVYIEGGAKYEYVNIPGVTSAEMNSNYFNRQLQMININEDKYVVLENNQEMIEIELMEKAPMFWKQSNTMVSFLDSLIVDGHNATLYTAFIGLMLVVITIRALRKRINGKHLLLGMLFGAVIVGVIYGYTLLRMDHILVTNAPISINLVFMLGVMLCTGVGLMLYFDAKTNKGKIIAIVVANLNSFVTVIIFGVVMLMKVIMMSGHLSIDKATYPWLFPLEKLILGSILYFGLFFTLNHFLYKKDKISRVEMHAGGES